MSIKKLFLNNYIKILTGLAVISIIFFVGAYICKFGLRMPTTTDDLIGKWGTFGDYFGGVLNPILGFCSFMALLYTVDLQNKQLKKTDEQLEQNRIALEQNAEALKLNNQELQNSNEQLQISAKAQAEMEKTQRLQQFEGLFTYMANELSKIYDELNNVKDIKNFYDYFENNYKYTVFQQKIIEDKNLSRFFIYLYQVLKFIDNQNFEKIQEKRYSNLIRSSLGNNTLQLLFINCVDSGYSDDFENYNRLVTKFNFFEHMDFYDNKQNPNYFLIYLTRFYQIEAFGNSNYYQRLMQNPIYHLITSSYYFWSPVNLFKQIIYSEPEFAQLEAKVKSFKFILDTYEKRPTILLKEIKTEHIFTIDIKKLRFHLDPLSLTFDFYIPKLGNLFVSIDKEHLIEFELEIRQGSDIFEGEITDFLSIKGNKLKLIPNQK